jgi:hypothetical protein
LIRTDRLRAATPATSSTRAERATQKHGQRQATTPGGVDATSREDRSPTPEPPGTRVFSLEIRTVSFPRHFHQPTSIDKYTGETDPHVWLNDYRLAC